jgi:hypothetical protein
MEALFEIIAEIAFDILGEGLFKKYPWLTHLLLGCLIIGSLILAFIFRSNIIIIVMMLIFAFLFSIILISLKRKDEDM